MAAFLPKKINDKTTEPSVLDKKVKMKFIKIKKAHLTFVYNLEHQLKGMTKKDIDNITKKMKIAFGTSCTYKNTDFGFGYGFAGDLAPRIKAYFIDNKILAESAFE